MRVSMLVILAVVGLAYGYTAPGVVWTSDSSNYPNQIIVDGSGNFYIIEVPGWYPALNPGSRIWVRKYSPQHTLLLIDSVDLGVGRVVKINKAIMNVSEIAITGSYRSGGQDTLYLQRIDLNGKALGGAPSFKSETVNNSEGYDIAVNGSSYDIVGIAWGSDGVIHADTLHHLRIWNTVNRPWGYDIGGPSGVSTDSVSKIYNFIKTSNGYIISAMWAFGVPKLVSVDNSYAYRWKSQTFASGQYVNSLYSPVVLKNDTPYVYFSYTATYPREITCRAKFNGVFYSSTALSLNTPTILRTDTSKVVRDLIVDPYGVFIFVNNICIRDNFQDTLWVAKESHSIYRSTIKNNGSVLFLMGDNGIAMIREIDREGIASITPLDTFQMFIGGSIPTTKIDTITNINTGIFGPLTATITYGSGGSGWLSTAVSGTDNTQTITNTIRNNSLPIGIYTATISLAGNYLRTLVPTTYQVVLKVTQSIGILNHTQKEQDQIVGVWSNNQGIKIGVGSGRYEITVCDLSGRIAYYQKSSSEGFTKIIPLSSHKAYIVHLKNETENIVKTVSFQ